MAEVNWIYGSQSLAYFGRESELIYIGIESKTPLLAFKSRNESQVKDMIQYLKLHYQICDSWLMTPSLAGFWVMPSGTTIFDHFSCGQEVKVVCTGVWVTADNQCVAKEGLCFKSTCKELFSLTLTSSSTPQQEFQNEVPSKYGMCAFCVCIVTGNSKNAFNPSVCSASQGTYQQRGSSQTPLISAPASW